MTLQNEPYRRNLEIKYKRLDRVHIGRNRAHLEELCGLMVYMPTEKLKIPKRKQSR